MISPDTAWMDEHGGEPSGAEQAALLPPPPERHAEPEPAEIAPRRAERAPVMPLIPGLRPAPRLELEPTAPLLPPILDLPSRRSLLQSPEGDPSRPVAILRGSARGLEIVVDGQASAGAIAAAVTARLAEAPGFFRGSDVRVRVDDGPLAQGCLGKLDDIAERFELRIVEVCASKPAGDGVPQPSFAIGSAPARGSTSETPIPTGSALISAASALVSAASAAMSAESTSVCPASAEAFADSVASALFAATEPPMPPVAIEPASIEAAPAPIEAAPAPIEAAPASIEAAPAAIEATPASIEAAPAPIEVTPAPIEVTPALIEAAPAAPLPPEIVIHEKTRVVVGPVRSGVILEHPGHLIIFGDVNPGAEVRAEGNIVVLGRLRGTAHAAIGRQAGFILSLRLEPQQLRIGRMVARASDSDQASSEAEIAHVTGDAIVVEPYHGKLPRSLAASI